jgi:hypothetical protein
VTAAAPPRRSPRDLWRYGSHRRSNSGRLAIFAAMRRASSRLSRCRPARGAQPKGLNLPPSIEAAALARADHEFPVTFDDVVSCTVPVKSRLLNRRSGARCLSYGRRVDRYGACALAAAIPTAPAKLRMVIAIRIRLPPQLQHADGLQ